MSAIVDQWVAAYRAELERISVALPKLAKSSKTRQAKFKANAVVPEGQECLLDLARATMFKADPGRGDGVPVDGYSVAIGKKIVTGIARVNREVLGQAANEETDEAQPPDEAQAEVQGTLKTLGVSFSPAEPSERKVHRPTKAERERLVALYAEWADRHDVMPPDNLLGHFSAWGRSTWAGVRGTLEARGYTFDGGRGAAIKVTERPKAPELTAPVSGGLEARMGQIEKLLNQLIANGGKRG